MNKFNISVNGTSYEVEVGDMAASPVEVMVNGKAYSVALDSGVSAAVPARTPLVAAAAPVALRAAPAAAAAPAAPAEAASGNVLAAPMPGMIRKVVVKVGDKVTRGQELCTLEAMKMKNIIRSPRDGVIASVEVLPDQKVVNGAVIVRYA
jgi:biotin carboxyl carrier protein